MEAMTILILVSSVGLSAWVLALLLSDVDSQRKRLGTKDSRPPLEQARHSRSIDRDSKNTAGPETEAGRMAGGRSCLQWKANGSSLVRPIWRG
jgi:hypothetical protein